MSETDTREAAEETTSPEVAAEPLPVPAGPADLSALTEAVSVLAEQVRSHHVRAQAREKVIDQLHAEVERLRVGEQGTVLRPVVTDLQNLREDLLRHSRTLPSGIAREQVAELLESFALSAELALERCGSVPVRPETGTKFSAREHRAVKVVEADRAEDDGTIAEVVADGYRQTGSERILVAAKVHVRRWARTPSPISDHEQEREGNTDV